MRQRGEATAKPRHTKNFTTPSVPTAHQQQPDEARSELRHAQVPSGTPGRVHLGSGFFNLCSATTVSTLGDGIYGTALPLLATTSTRSRFARCSPRASFPGCWSPYRRGQWSTGSTTDG
jgi:hypothetical protein